MKDRIILDLCGGTGSWSKPYKDAGYDVELITIPWFDVRNYTPPEKVYGILAAPPCTMFSLARKKAKTPRDFKGAMEIVEACLKIIWRCRFDGSLKFWAMENPVGYLRHFLGRPPFTFRAWEFGDIHSKRTDIWGNFNIPEKSFDEKHLLVERNIDKQWQKPIVPDHVKHLKLDRAAIRAITPQGFAQAFFEANP